MALASTCALACAMSGCLNPWGSSSSRNDSYHPGVADSASLTLKADDQVSFGTQPVGVAKDLTLNLVYSGNTPATQVQLAGLGSGISFKGNTFPGTGGTCAPTINADCTLVLTYQPSAVAASSPTLSLSYFAGAEARLLSFRVNGTGILLLGQPDSFSNLNRVYGINQPASVRVSGGRLIISDAGNWRVLIWNHLPASSAQPPDVVMGLPSINGLGPAIPPGARLSNPTSAQIVQNKLLIADYGNNRVLIWNSVPANGQQSADLVLGQPDFSTTTANSGGISGQTMNGPRDVFSDGTRLFVTDFNNHRLLVWTSFPTRNQQAPDAILGQPDANSHLCNQGGLPSDQTLCDPTGVFFDGTNLYVADFGNSRVLIWTGIPNGPAPQQAANRVLGHSLFNVSASNDGGAAGARTLSFPSAVCHDGTHLFVADALNNRVLMWNGVPATNDSASLVLGQADFGSTANNRGGSVSAAGLSTPSGGLDCDGARLFVSDTGNNRVLSWSSQPTQNGQLASGVIGQPDFVSSQPCNSGTPVAQNLNFPIGVATLGNRLFVMDTGNSRALIWNTEPTANQQLPDLVLGQPNFTTANPALSQSNQTVSTPAGAATDGATVFISDNNNRILFWTSPIASNQTPAAHVLGQISFSATTMNEGGAPTQRSLAYPRGLAVVGNRLVAADSVNNRVLIWSPLPTGDHEAASLVLGQSTMSTSNAASGAQGLSAPISVATDGTRLIVADSINNRVLIWKQMPSSSGQPADVVIGQPDMTSNTWANGGVTARSLAGPQGVYCDGTRLYVVDSGANRVLVWNRIPDTNFTPADFVIGQPDFSSYAPGLDATHFFGPLGVTRVGNSLFIADYGNSRVVAVPVP